MAVDIEELLLVVVVGLVELSWIDFELTEIAKIATKIAIFMFEAFLQLKVFEGMNEDEFVSYIGVLI